MTNEPSLSRHAETLRDSESGNSEEQGNGAISRKTTRDHALASLVELNHDLARASDIFETARLLLLSLMGQLGTSRGMVWMHSENEAALPVLLSAHGVSKPLARAVVSASSLALWKRFTDQPGPLEARAVGDQVGPLASTLVTEAGLTLFAPARADERFMIIAAVGPPFGERRYGALEMTVLEASLAVAGVAFARMDISNWQAEAMRRLREENDTLRRREELNARGISHVADALQSPLAVLSGCLEQLEERANRSQRGTLAVANAAARNLDSLIGWLSVPRDLDQLSRQIHLTGTDLHEALMAFFKDRGPSVACARCEMWLEAPKSLPQVICDRGHLATIMNGLLDEVLRSARPGNRITLRARENTHEIPAAVEISFELGDCAPRSKTEVLGLGSLPLSDWDRSQRGRIASLEDLAKELAARIEIRGSIMDGGTFSLILLSEEAQSKAA